jgi:hypothetical protein
MRMIPYPKEVMRADTAIGAHTHTLFFFSFLFLSFFSPLSLISSFFSVVCDEKDA